MRGSYLCAAYSGEKLIGDLAQQLDRAPRTASGDYADFPV